MDRAAGSTGTYSVVALVDREDVVLPAYLEIESGGGKKRVPVELRVEERFEPEGTA